MSIFTDQDPKYSILDLGFDKNITKGFSPSGPPSTKNLFLEGSGTGDSRQIFVDGRNNVYAGVNTGAFPVQPGGQNSITIGKTSFSNVVAGDDNFAAGQNVLAANTTGTANIAIGKNALQTNVTGSNNIAIGAGADVASSALSNTIAIGQNANAYASNTIILGGSANMNVTSFGAGTFAMASILINQAQNTTVSRITISGIADNEAGMIECLMGGNVGAIDRASVTYHFSYLRDAGIIYFNSSLGQITGGATAAYLIILAVNSGGVIVIQTQMTAFGAGSFVGNLLVRVIKSSSGLDVRP